MMEFTFKQWLLFYLIMGDKIGLGFVSICVSFIIVLFSALLLMKPIHVKRSTVYQKNKCWHYMELSKVVVTKTRICRVYSEGKMIFRNLLDCRDEQPGWLREPFIRHGCCM